MNGEPAPPPDDGAPQPGAGAAEAISPRPWTPAAAMEPVPPLAPPPARPGAGTRVAAATRVPSARASHRTVLLVGLALVVVAVVLVLLVLGH